MTDEDKVLEQARAKVATATMLTGYADYAHELALRRSWNRAVEVLFNEHPSVGEFSWQQYTQKEGGFWLDHNKVEVDGQCYHDVDRPDDEEASAAYKDAVELLLFFTMNELRSLFGNFVRVTVSRGGWVLLEVAEGV